MGVVPVALAREAPATPSRCSRLRKSNVVYVGPDPVSFLVVVCGGWLWVNPRVNPRALYEHIVMYVCMLRVWLWRS